MWEISNHKTLNWLVLANTMHSHATVEKKISYWRRNAELKIKFINIVSTSGHPDKLI